MIKQAYLAQVVQSGVAPSQAQELWFQIEIAYTEAGRYYHDLSHLEHLFLELKDLQFEDWPTVLFSVVYHDVVYDVEQHLVMNDNEERSAAFAERHLAGFQYPAEKIEKCRQQIMATKKHGLSKENDTNLIIDADLSILGQDWEVYDSYRCKIREEFGVYPDSIFNAGRRKVLLYFLQMEPLFKTPHFRQLYEEKAKENLRRELELLR